MLSAPFKTPLSEMGKLSRVFYRTKWELGYRVIGPSSWPRRIKGRLSFERWVLSNVSGWPGYLVQRLGVGAPFSATVGGREFRVRNVAERVEFTRILRESFGRPPFAETVLGENNGIFNFGFAGKSLSFPYSGDRYGTRTVLQEFFLKEPYAELDVVDKDVIDVGSSIGDTPIYFALKGARRVISFEPYPATFQKAKSNIEANGLGDRVVLLNEGAGRSGWMRLTREPRNLWANAVPSSEGQEVRFNSLNEIITRFRIETAVLKYHGEGSEYEFFGGASHEDLTHFPQISLKYHYGATPIVRKLKSAGFEITRKWDLHFSCNRSSSSPRYEAGMITAKRIAV